MFKILLSNFWGLKRPVTLTNVRNISQCNNVNRQVENKIKIQLKKSQPKIRTSSDVVWKQGSKWSLSHQEVFETDSDMLRDPVEDPEIVFLGIGVSMLRCGNKSKEYKIELKLKILLGHLHQIVSQSTNVVHLKQVLWNCRGIFLDNAFPLLICIYILCFFMSFVYLSSLLQKTHKSVLMLPSRPQKNIYRIK